MFYNNESRFCRAARSEQLRCELRQVLIIIVLTFTFFLVYIPHLDYPFPRHVDEWHHITEAIKLEKGEYSGGATGYRIGFHILLLLLSKITNLVLIYQFLPAIWAVISALVLFYVVYKKTNKQFSIALLAMIFFASIKSNVNITGLWFFTPLTFSIPFIFLYVYFFTEGIEKHNRKFILLSLAIMILLLFIHSISVLFAIPFLLIYSLFNFRYLKKEWKFFLIFLIIPIIGILFYKFIWEVPFEFLIRDLIKALQFKRGWGVLELDNSFFELYSLMGYILAVVGLVLISRLYIYTIANQGSRAKREVLIFRHRENVKKYLAYGLWPITVLTSIMIYKKTGISYLSPYQRNLYYFALSLPILSAFGLDYLLKIVKKSIIRTSLTEVEKEFLKRIFFVLIFIVVIFFTFKSYLKVPSQVALYQVIDNGEYQALLFLSNIPEKSVVMALPRISEALYPISGHKPVATYIFYGKRADAERFFLSEDCETRQQILDRYKVKYVLSKLKIDCGWKLIYPPLFPKKRGVYEKENYIYEIN